MIDSNLIFNEISSSGLPALAVESGSELIDAWIEQCFAEDTRYRTLLVEGGFFIELSPKTFVVGACDRVMRDGDGVLIEEAKSTSKSKTWTAERWFDSLQRGHQVPTYAAALKHGTFLFKNAAPPDSAIRCYGPESREWAGEVEFLDIPVAPRILVRAATKSKPPEIWPGPEGQIIEVEPRRIDAALSMYANEAEAIRARRRTARLPWNLPGKHCEKVYGRTTYVCEFAEECGRGEWPSGPVTHRGLSPGSSEVVEHLVATGRIDSADPEIVVLSASSMEDAMQCSERWRRRSLGQRRETRDSLDVGTVLHLGLKSYHEQLRAKGY